MKKPTFIGHVHPTAILDSDAEIASDVEIGPYCVIGPGVQLGKRTKIGSHVVIQGRTTLGDDNVVFPFATIGTVPQDLKYKGEPSELVPWAPAHTKSIAEPHAAGAPWKPDR